MYDFFTFSPQPIVIISNQHKEWLVKDINSAFLTLSGYMKDDLIGKSASILSHSSPFCQVLTRLAALQKAKTEDSTLECEISTRSGQCLTVSLQMSRIRSVSGDHLFAVVIVDISEKAWIENIILDQKVEASMLLTADGVIKSINRYYSPVRFNVSRLLEGSVADFLLQKDKFRIYRFFETLKANKTEGQTSFTLTLFGDQFTSTVIAKPFYRSDGNLKCYAIVFTKLALIDPFEDPSFKLRLLMTEKKISVTQLAHTTDISLTTISKIRNGKIKKPQRITADLIAGKLGVVPGEIWSCFR
ncbi:PAS domain S-box protein [Paenibacillus solisilvae]|uniref:PAS domain S-box protein n=1 Tax=Paenibacillus solisilvae TaxID=2486751 RepID=A0ABW0W1K2_9BACL